VSKLVSFFGSDGFGTYEFEPSREPVRRADSKTDTLVVPGFVDIHTHGGFGIDFMGADSAQMSRLCRELRAVGYEGFLPTTVTASVKDVTRALSILPSDPMILGLHLEGPFISLKYPGAQPQSWIVDPPTGPSEWDPILDDPRLKVITLAPERPGAAHLIRRLSARGVRVSMGHTDATYLQADEGFQAGADHSTHTFNAMRPLHHREAGIVGYALCNDDLYSELIYDRLHVCRESAEVLFRCKPADRVVAISDSTMAAGLPAGQTVTMWGLECIVGDREVRLTNGTLAGSGITLLDAFRNLHEDFGAQTAIRCCCINPRRAIGHSAPTSLFVEFDRNLEIVNLIDVPTA
jgi:N-acetylglucosamine-6-phosphate deacetylase